MHLSEHDLKILDDMENSLNKEDPELVRKFSKLARSMQMKNFVLGVLYVVFGLFGLLASVISKIIIISLPSFILICLGIWMIVKYLQIVQEDMWSTGSHKKNKYIFKFTNSALRRWQDFQKNIFNQ